MKISSSWRGAFCALVAWISAGSGLLGQTSEPPESVEPPLQITSDGANRYEGGIYYAEDNVTVVAHPECTRAVRALADEVCSTEKWATARSTPKIKIIMKPISPLLLAFDVAVTALIYPI